MSKTNPILSTFVAALLLLSSCAEETPQTHMPEITIELDREQAERLSELALHCIDTPYPYKAGHTLGDASSLKEPQVHHPAFYGCFDWHSAVHGHWSLIHILRRFPEVQNADEIRQKINANLTVENILAEAAYFDDSHNKNFERTYGWAWVLKLAQELRDWEDSDGQRWALALLPLEQLMIEKFLDFLPKLSYPIRIGEHSNTAFGLTFAWDYAMASGNVELQNLIRDRSRTFYLDDVDCPISWEPGGFDFLSPCLEEAELMARVLNDSEFESWFSKFLPNPYQLEPAIVSDRTDGKIVHLDGLNFSRAWSIRRISKKLGSDPKLLQLANQHLNASLVNVKSGDYAGEHWLASFALYALASKK